MKVVLFCGGLGMRMREYSDSIPKPMIEIGYRPILWHVMRYYAYFGHKEFILCLGHRADVVKKYFMNYDEYLSNNFILAKGGSQIELLNNDITDWKITFVETGLNSNIGQRLCAIEKYLANDSVFLANYADGLSDLNLEHFLARFLKTKNVGAFLCVKPAQSTHVVTVRGANQVIAIKPFRESDIWINGGFFIFRKEIFQYINKGEELVEEPFRRLIAANKLMTQRHKGFWIAMDTFKDKRLLDDLVQQGPAPWELWKLAADKEVGS